MEVDPARLPHWSRVSFAARCARRVKPLFDKAWPDTDTSAGAAIENAIKLVEQSVVEGRSVAGLREATIALLILAGQALAPYIAPDLFEEEDLQPAPGNKEMAEVASFVTRAAERAAHAAGVKPSESAYPAQEAYSFALSALQATGNIALVEILEADFAQLAELSSKKPWWRFW